MELFTLNIFTKKLHLRCLTGSYICLWLLCCTDSFLSFGHCPSKKKLHGIRCPADTRNLQYVIFQDIANFDKQFIF